MKKLFDFIKDNRYELFIYFVIPGLLSWIRISRFSKTFLITFVLIIIEIVLMLITVLKKHKKKFLGIVSCSILSIAFLGWTYIDFFGGENSIKIFFVIISIICLAIYVFNPNFDLGKTEDGSLGEE